MLWRHIFILNNSPTIKIIQLRVLLKDVVNDGLTRVQHFNNMIVWRHKHCFYLVFEQQQLIQTTVVFFDVLWYYNVFYVTIIVYSIFLYILICFVSFDGIVRIFSCRNKELVFSWNGIEWFEKLIYLPTTKTKNIFNVKLLCNLTSGFVYHVLF